MGSFLGHEVAGMLKWPQTCLVPRPGMCKPVPPLHYIPSCSFIHSLVFSLKGRAWQEPEPRHVTGMALAHCILGKFLGVVCHCFPLLRCLIKHEQNFALLNFFFFNTATKYLCKLWRLIICSRLQFYIKVKTRCLSEKYVEILKYLLKPGTARQHVKS